ncbi:MAG: 50S ribosomal protein L9 [Caldimicrobium sp.]|jgi:large subunit ribosomal protein L9|nr:50S ribosomal protein L9 [Caldimicrobium sp.]
MEVILRTDVPKLGKAGDIVKVKDGFARNYLLPKGLAIPANQKTIKALENQRKIILAKAERERKKAQSLAEKLTGLTLTFYRKVIEGDRIYGSISAQDIVKSLEEKGLSLERRFVLLDEPIKQLGTYEIPIRLRPGVEVKIQVEVVEEK